MVVLLDSSLLVALTFSTHVHHEPARAWLGPSDPIATCPLVQGALLRFLLRQGVNRSDAVIGLQQIVDLPQHEQWLDDLTYLQVDLTRVVGHAQVTDAYLAQLARSRGGRVATLDRGFAAAASDVVDLVTT